MFISLKTKIFLAHLFLILILVSSLSYKHYTNMLDNYINNIITFYTNSSSSIVTTASLAISGTNYGNIQLPSFIEEVSRNKKLLFFTVTGFSDNTLKKFTAVYSKKHQNIFRNEYPTNYEKELKDKITKFKSKLNDPSSDKVKLNFLIERTNDKLNQYNLNMRYSKNLNDKYTSLLAEKSSYIDFENNLLHISIATNNINGGKVSMVFDISEIKDIRFSILKDLIIEISISLLFAIIILMIVAKKVIDPLKRLSIYMSNDVQNLSTNNIPGLDLKDEIGILSRSFHTLLQTVKDKQIKTEKKAYIDGLTNIYNRNKFEEVFQEELQRVKRYKHPLSIALIDIDRFKNFNDTYGHLIGDEVLISMAQTVNSKVRGTDTFARWGGEEFILLFTETDIQTAENISFKLKELIQKVEHPIAGKITASIGLTQYIDGDTKESIFKRCDKALYLAKENGRNRISIL